MKRVTNYLCMFFMSATVLFVTSCGDDAEDILTPDGPSISIEDENGTEISDTTLAPGDTIEIYLAIELEDAESANVSVVDDVSNAPVYETILNAEPPTSTQVTYIVPSNATGTVTLTANLTDDSNASLDSDDITITSTLALLLKFMKSSCSLLLPKTKALNLSLVHKPVIYTHTLI